MMKNVTNLEETMMCFSIKKENRYLDLSRRELKFRWLDA